MERGDFGNIHGQNAKYKTNRNQGQSGGAECRAISRNMMF